MMIIKTLVPLHSILAGFVFTNTPVREGEKYKNITWNCRCRLDVECRM